MNEGADKVFIYKKKPGSRVLDMREMLSERYKQDVTFASFADFNREGCTTPTVLINRVLPSLPKGTTLDSMRDCELFELSVTSEVAPVSDSGKSGEEWGTLGARQYHRHFFKTSHAFKDNDGIARHAVTDHFDRCYEPLQGAIQMLSDRCHALRQCINAPDKSIDSTTLSSLLYGSLLTSVNEGPVGICQTFLFNSDNWDRTGLFRLIQTFQEFLDVADESLRVHDRLRSADMEEWQQQARSAFRQLHKDVFRGSMLIQKEAIDDGFIPVDPTAVVNTSSMRKIRRNSASLANMRVENPNSKKKSESLGRKLSASLRASMKKNSRAEKP